MIRLFFLATLFLALLGASANAQTPGSKVCGGIFERFLKGFSIDVERGEMDPFLRDDAAVAACRQQLDLTKPDHALVEGFLRQHRVWLAANEGEAFPVFEGACAMGRKLACAYAISSRPGPRHRSEDDAARRRNLADLKALLGTGLPVVNYMIGMMMIHGSEPHAGVKLLRRASAQGDRMAMLELLVLETDFAGAEEDPRTMPTFLAGLRKASDQGDVAAMVKMADHSIEAFADYSTALAFYRRAVNADPRWFQSAIGEACYKLGLMLRDGIATPLDAEQARRLFDRARALGYEDRYGLPKPFDKP